MNKIKTVTFIGSGNVATHLAKKLFTQKIIIQQICSKSIENATILATQTNAQPIDNIANIDTNVDLIIIAAKDDLIQKIQRKLAKNNPTLKIVHTSASVGADIFDKKLENFGVFYPLQTFTKNKPINLQNVPFCLYANNPNFNFQLKELAAVLSDKIYFLNDEQRKHLHIAAVVVNNFTNYLYTIAQQHCEKHQIAFDILYPLIDETFDKVKHFSAVEMQTGPAKRGDIDIVNKHVELIKNEKSFSEIYQFLSQKIIEKYQ